MEGLEGPGSAPKWITRQAGEGIAGEGIAGPCVRSKAAQR